MCLVDVLIDVFMETSSTGIYISLVWWHSMWVSAAQVGLLSSGYLKRSKAIKINMSVKTGL